MEIKALLLERPHELLDGAIGVLSVSPASAERGAVRLASHELNSFCLSGLIG